MLSRISIDVRRAIAPMVNQSDAPFRALCMKYGATCAYSQMLYADKIVDDVEYLDAFLPDIDVNFEHSLPLIVQLCGNNPKILSSAVAKLLTHKNFIDGIDFNLGCPQDRAYEGKYGSYLLDKYLWGTVFECVKEMSQALNGKIPLSCKIRFVEGSNLLLDTIEFCEGLVENGADIICVHGRRRGSPKNRRAGPADLLTIGKIASHLKAKYPHIKIISNGNLYSHSDIPHALKESCPCDGIMAAEGLLRDPSMFAGTLSHSQISPILIPDRNDLFNEYCQLSELYEDMNGWKLFQKFYNLEEPVQIYIARQHLQWMLEKQGHGRSVRFNHINKEVYKKQTHLLKALNEASSLADLKVISSFCLKKVGRTSSIYNSIQ